MKVSTAEYQREWAAAHKRKRRAWFKNLIQYADSIRDLLQKYRPDCNTPPPPPPEKKKKPLPRKRWILGVD